MDWDQIIESNRQRILCAIAPLLAVLGFDPARGAMAPHVYRALIMLLCPAESAVRRLIVMAARGVVVRLAASRGFPTGLSLKLKLAFETRTGQTRIAAFPLMDPLKRCALGGIGWGKAPGKYCISTPAPVPLRSRGNPAGAAALLRRIEALKSALDDLPREAKRLARWKARRDLAAKTTTAPKYARLSPFRQGFAPGFHRHKSEEIDVILADCHYFARQAWARPDTS